MSGRFDGRTEPHGPARTVVGSGDARLAFFPGSPFARMARIFVREWALPVAEEEWPFPPPPELFELNPLGQVPVLVAGLDRVFPTFEVLVRLWQMAGSPPDAWQPERERQTLLTVLAAGDALVAARYQRWAGLRQVEPNHVGYDPGARHMARFESVIAWTAGNRLRDGLTLPGVAAACLLLWSDARGGPAWRGHRTLERLVGALAARDSFGQTEPQPWLPDGEENA